MGHLDEQLKELQTLKRDSEAKMRTYHQAKAKLYERERPQRKSLGKIIGVPVAVMAALFIGFLISYQWFGDLIWAPASEEEETQNKIIQSDIKIAYVMEGAELDWNLEVVNPAAEVIEDLNILIALKDTLNAPHNEMDLDELTGKSFYPGIELRIEQADDSVHLFRVGADDSYSYVWPSGADIYFQYDKTLWETFALMLEDHSESEFHVERFDNLTEALTFFSQDNVGIPVNYDEFVYSIQVVSHYGDPIEMALNYGNANDDLFFTFSIQVNEYIGVLEGLDEVDWQEQEYYELKYLHHEGPGELQSVKWEEEYLTYVIELHHIDIKEVLTNIVGPLMGYDDFGDGETTGRVAVEKYNVFADYELNHHALSSGLSFHMNESWDLVIGWGHQNHAMGLYELFQVNEAGDEVTKIRRLNEEHGIYYEQASELQESENWNELVELILEQGLVMDDIFFKYDAEVQETEIAFYDQSFTVYPVELPEVTYYFREGYGLWAQLYTSQTVIEWQGEPQLATRILE